MKKILLNEKQYKSLKRILFETKLRSYIFDWDDNILHMPTKIKMDKKEGDNWVPVEVSTEEFAEVRSNPDYRIRNNNVPEAFSNFRQHDTFLHDVEEAIHNQDFAPSYEKFKEALIYGNDFAINTARGHKSKTIRDGVKLFINMVFDKNEKKIMVDNIKKINPDLKNDEQVIDWYLDNMGEYYAVSSDEFMERFNLSGDAASNPEKSKQMAIQHFVDKVKSNIQKFLDNSKYKKMSFGFSDDDKKNVNAVKSYIDKELKKLYPDFHFIVYDTSERGKKKIVIQKELNENVKKKLR
jgi:hypothetical protein